MDAEGRIPKKIAFSVPLTIQPSKGCIRLLRKEYIEIDLEVRGKPTWKGHSLNEQIDVAVIDLTNMLTSMYQGNIYEPIIAVDEYTKPALSVMDTAIVAGFPSDNPAILPNEYPIYKTCFIASEPEFSGNLPYILLDGKTKKGMSGSPVYIKFEPNMSTDLSRGISFNTGKVTLIGIYSGRDINDEALTKAELGIIWPLESCVIPIIEKFFCRDKA